jgi:hypothetical protein
MGRDAKTGALRFGADVPPSTASSWMSSLTIDGGQAFVVLDQKLHVFDAASDALVRTLEDL